MNKGIKKICLVALAVVILAGVFAGCRDDSLEAQLKRANDSANQASEAYQKGQDTLDEIYKDKN
jgi:outer membrane PBP1 activator LpoA protein